MSNELRLKISGDWFDLREAALDSAEAARALGLVPLKLQHISEELRNCVEEGILEFKRDNLKRVLSPLDTLAHNSRALASLPAGAEMAAAAAWCCLQQRRIALGKVPTSREFGDGTDNDERADAGVSTEMSPAELIGAVQNLLEGEPELKDEPEAKMVVLQLKQYRQEMMKLKELLISIPEEKRKPLKENFAYRLREIIGKMNQGYQELIRKSRNGREEKKEEEPTGSLLSRVDKGALSAMAKRFLQESEMFSRIRSVLLFAEKEKYRSRQILMDLQRVGEELLSLMNLEGSDYKTLAPFGDGAKTISFEMARIVRFVAADTAELL